MVRALFPPRGDRWWTRFALMMALSVTIAVMGLSTDSSAVVIGAMLIAPLMTPVLAVGAALVMALPRQLARACLTVLAAAAGAVALAALLALLLPTSARALTSEVLSRTSPDFRDLVVTLAAGAAGAYATTREDISAALPGVAVAVALVPPLAVVGYTLAAGRADLARGAALLFGANLAAIILAALVVFAARGFVPTRRAMRRSRRMVAGIIAALVAAAVVSIPLAARSAAVIRAAHQAQGVNTAVADWLGLRRHSKCRMC